MNRLAVMQPYLFPYLGYFQLMTAVDRFVLFDDVHFINKGWINRNRILLNGQAHLFTMPLKGASQNKRICEIELGDVAVWKRKFLATLTQAYRAAPYRDRVVALVDQVLDPTVSLLDELLRNVLRQLAQQLGIGTPIVGTSRVYDNQHLKGADRILDICRQEKATDYVNAIGGLELYDRVQFQAASVELRFLKTCAGSYVQGNGQKTFVPSLSILDVMMFNSYEESQKLLHRYELV